MFCLSLSLSLPKLSYIFVAFPKKYVSDFDGRRKALSCGELGMQSASALVLYYSDPTA